MTASHRSIFDDLTVDHVVFYSADLRATTDWLVSGYGFETFAASPPGSWGRALGLGRNNIRMLVSEPGPADRIGTAYVERHGDGVADIALRVPDAAEALETAVRCGAQPVRELSEHEGVRTASVVGFGDVLHTFVERAPGVSDRILPGMAPATGSTSADGPRLFEMDHFAICVPAGELEPTVEFYQRVLGFATIFTEHIRVGKQAMNSKVVQSRSGAVTLTLLEPDPRHDPGQIDSFLSKHGGAGVQHIAFTTDDIVKGVSALDARGVAFLSSPDTYYQMVEERLQLAKHTIPDLRKLGVLVDEDHHGQLYQIFARSVHPRGTFFNEIIERLGARTFGSSNIKALYQAVELQRSKEL